MWRAVFLGFFLLMYSPSVRSELLRGTVYFTAGAVLDSMAWWSLLGSAVVPGRAGKECELVSSVCRGAAERAFRQLFSGERPVSSYESWERNRERLAQIPAESLEEKELLQFLERRWLAKASGFFPSMLDWVCPCFGVSVQVHPSVTSSYARDPATTTSRTYEKRAAAWKQILPHPPSFPLLLTRPHDVRPYLPMTQIFDLTEEFSSWDLSKWEDYRSQLLQTCNERKIDPNQMICIQRVQQEGIGGIRLLPLTGVSHEAWLLRWISEAGLTANPAELDRKWVPQKSFSLETPSLVELPKSSYPQQGLFIEATGQILDGLLAAVSGEKWEQIRSCPTRASIVNISLAKIQEELDLAAQQTSFFRMVSRMEEVHAHLSSLLEVCSPFTYKDFAPIYGRCMAHIPEELKPLLACALHSGAMASFAGIVKAAERTAGRRVRVLYGENTYFECINVVERTAEASPVEEATEEDLKQVDLIVAQFNPALKRPALSQNGFNTTRYRTEQIADTLRKTLRVRGKRPLTVALDCTFDFIDSARVALLANEFSQEIQEGILNVVCYRSGLKFDLFGMDNYAGAPFAMIHQGPAWAFFDTLLNDPVLQTDRLSLQWFCLAYQHAAPQLELYRRQIFDNTRAFLNQIPKGLYAADAKYRIIPVDPEVDSGFIDFKVFGPLHSFRGAAVAGGYLLHQCLEKGHPMFMRRSLGFYHPNFSILFGEENSTIRLTLGIDPGQVDLLVQCFEEIDLLNR